MAITNIFLNIFFTFLLFSIKAFGDQGQWDCQDNEFFIDCGGCEGTCKEPVITNCSSICKPGRCECQALNGFVRSHDGACIKYEDCGSYVGIEIYGDSNPKMLDRQPTAAAPLVLSNQQQQQPSPPSDSEDYHQQTDNFQQNNNNNNYDDETEAPASAAASNANDPFQQAASLLAPSHSPSQQQQHQQQTNSNNNNYHPAKISETGPYYPSSSINSNQYRRRFRHRFFV